VSASIRYARCRRDLVAGDVAPIETCNVMPADGCLAYGRNLRIHEAALTGQSEAVEKDADIVFTGERSLGDRRTMDFSGTLVS
jgi:P-type Ca2+ transporter type 2C